MVLAHRLPPLLWQASPNFSSRHGEHTDLVVVHSTEGNYKGSINWFSQSQSQVSAHFVVREDGLEATQMVHLPDKAWHACSFNPRSIGVELSGFAAKGLSAPEWESAANIIAWLCSYLHVPAQWAREGSGPGFCRHFDLGVAGGGHRDPTTDPAVWANFISLTADAAKQVDASQRWVPGMVPIPMPYDLSTDEAVQDALNRLGCARPLLVVDGKIGQKSMAAIITFQRTHGLPVTGKADPATLTAIQIALKAPVSSCTLSQSASIVPAPGSAPLAPKASGPSAPSGSGQ